jgi:hypothetical protein
MFTTFHGSHGLIALALAAMALLLLYGLRASPTPFKATRKRRGTDPSMRPQPNDEAVTFSVVANKLRVTCLKPYSTNGIPYVAASGGAHTGTEHPTALTVVSSTVFDLTFAHNVAAADVIAYPGHDPAVRFAQGQYVAAKNQTL